MRNELLSVRRRHRLEGLPAEPTERFAYSTGRVLTISPELRLSSFKDAQPETEECCVAALNLRGDSLTFDIYLMHVLGGRVPLIAAFDLLADRRHTLTLGQLEALTRKTSEGCDTGLHLKAGRGRRLPLEGGFFVETRRGIELGTVRYYDGLWRVMRILSLHTCDEDRHDLSTLFVANLRHPL